MRNDRTNRKGVTLVELIIAVGLLAVVSAGAYSLLTLGIRSYNLHTESSVSQTALRESALHLSKVVKNAPNGSVSTDGTTVTADSAVYSVSDGTLYYGGSLVSRHISSLTATLTNNILTVTLTAEDGQTLETSLHTSP